MFLVSCLILDFGRYLSRRHWLSPHQSVHFCRHCPGRKPFCKTLNLFWTYSFQAFRFYSLALNCLLYSLITFLRRKKKKKRNLNFPKAPDLFLGFTKKSNYPFCIVLICLDIASQWIIHLVLEFKDPHSARLCVTTWTAPHHSSSAGTHHWSSSLSTSCLTLAFHLERKILWCSCSVCFWHLFT